jgi:hypothetical protein
MAAGGGSAAKRQCKSAQWRSVLAGKLVDAETLGTQLADQILAGGGRQVLDTVRPSAE